MRNYFNVPTMEARQVFDPNRPYAFLGGTINGSTWRNKLAPQLTCEFFDPVVLEWSPDDRKREDDAKTQATIHVYALTPKQTGFYGIAEMTQAVCGLSQRKVALLFLDEDDGTTYEEHQASSVAAIRELLSAYVNVSIFDSVDHLAAWLNTELQDGNQGTA
ncbi:hypothetical protein D3C71_78980 [compost metagenome]